MIHNNNKKQVTKLCQPEDQNLNKFQLNFLKKLKINNNVKFKMKNF